MIPKLWVNETFSVSDRWAKLTLKKRGKDVKAVASLATLISSEVWKKPNPTYQREQMEYVGLLYNCGFSIRIWKERSLLGVASIT
jgi:hypothetical protein